MDLKVLSIDEMKTLADGLSLKYHPAIGEDNLRKKLERHVEENPGCLGSDPVAAPLDPVVTESNPLTTPDVSVVPEKKEPVVKPTKGKIKVKSQFTGEISSRFGVVDFGADGIIELEPEAAEYFCSLPYGYEKC